MSRPRAFIKRLCKAHGNRATGLQDEAFTAFSTQRMYYKHLSWPKLLLPAARGNAVSLCQQAGIAFVLQKCEASNAYTHRFAAFHLATVSSFAGAALFTPTLHGLVVPTKPILLACQCNVLGV